MHFITRGRNPQRPVQDILLLWISPWVKESDAATQSSPTCMTCRKVASRWVVKFHQGVSLPVEPTNRDIVDRKRFHMIHRDMIANQDQGVLSFHPTRYECDACASGRIDRWDVGVKGKAVIRALHRAVVTFPEAFPALLLCVSRKQHQFLLKAIPQDDVDGLNRALRSDVSWAIVKREDGN